MTFEVRMLASPDYDSHRQWLGTRSYWLCQAIGWGGLLVLMLGPLPLNNRATAAEVAALVFYCLTGVLLSHALRAAILAALRITVTWPGLLGRLLPGLIVAPVVHVLIQIAWARNVLPHDAMLFSSRPGRDPVLFTFADTLSMSGGLFVVWTGAYFGLRLYRQYQRVRIERLELAAHLQEAAWQALRAQLNPHLLFNSLNSIRALIPADLKAPREALTHLSELLRSSLSLRQDELIPLHRELETVESFLALERLRFEQRLRCTSNVEPAARAWLVPPFLVQILIENAVKYGVAPYEDGGDIALTIRVADERLLVEVTNRGQLGERRSPTSTGLGLTNLRSRLALLFGPAATLTVENAGPERVRAQVAVPRRPPHAPVSASNGALP